jgi:hypothetical protein
LFGPVNRGGIGSHSYGTGLLASQKCLVGIVVDSASICGYASYRQHKNFGTKILSVGLRLVVASKFIFEHEESANVVLQTVGYNHISRELGLAPGSSSLTKDPARKDIHPESGSLVIRTSVVIEAPVITR